jgi:hypothetical protein
MKANELRIGNWVNFIPDKGNFIISDIKTFNENTINGLELEDCQPIPLTEEWFLKFKFEIKNHSSIDKTPIYSKGEIDIDYCFSYADFREDYSFYVEYTDSPFDSDTDKLYPVSLGIKYVHQLQNLWFTLTGEELI